MAWKDTREMSVERVPILSKRALANALMCPPGGEAQDKGPRPGPTKKGPPVTFRLARPTASTSSVPLLPEFRRDRRRVPAAAAVGVRSLDARRGEFVHPAVFRHQYIQRFALQVPALHQHIRALLLDRFCRREHAGAVRHRQSCQGLGFARFSVSKYACGTSSRAARRTHPLRATRPACRTR